jgi:plastocyanin
VTPGRASGALAAGLATLFVGVAGAGCGGSGKSGGGAGAKVKAGDFFFAPQEMRVKAGQTVTWTNTGQTIHTVKGQGFFSQAIDPGRSYSNRFTHAGRFPYLCTLHPQQMRGTVVVG